MDKLLNYDGLCWFMDGDATVVVQEDFVNLQESPAIFLECPRCGCNDIIPPSEDYSEFTCDKCGLDFRPDLTSLYL